MKRPLIPLLLSYICGVVGADLLRYIPITVCSFVICMFIITIIVTRRCFKQAFITPVLFFYVVGFSYTLWISRIPPDDISYYATGENRVIIGVVDEIPEYYTRRVVTYLRVKGLREDGKEINVRGRIRLSVYDSEIHLEYGDILLLRGKLKDVRGYRNPGLFNYAKYVSRMGVRARIGIAKREDIEKIGVEGIIPLRKFYRWRERIRVLLKGSLSKSSSAILQTMIIGAKGALNEEIRDKFTAAGVAHILSISGAHLGFIAFFIYFLIRYSILYLPVNILSRLTMFALPSRIAALGTLPPVGLYTLLSGGKIATVRAMIMVLIYFSAFCIERDNDSLNALVVAAFIVLLWDPHALFDISFQLSYMAVLSMILIIKKLNKGDNKDNRRDTVTMRCWFKVKSFMFLTLGATIFTAPIGAHYFNQVTWVGVLANMIVVPYVGFLVLPAGFFSSFISVLFGTERLFLASLNEILLKGLVLIVGWFASLPGSIFHIPSPSILTVLLIYAILLVFFLPHRKWIKKGFSISLSILVLYSCLHLFLAWKRDVMRVSFLDVGQGDSVLIEFPGGEVMLIDGGGTFSDTFDTGRSIIAPFLWNRGIRKIGYLVSTHPQLDHVEGLSYIVKNFRVGEVWTDGISTSASSLFDTLVEKKDLKKVIVRYGMKERIIGDCLFKFLNPSEESYSDSWKINDLSIVMHITCGDVSFLFPGDIEMRAIKTIMARDYDLKSTVLKVPHHGSRSSLEWNFIRAVRPSVAVISAGHLNAYNHPSPLVVEAYERIGASIYRTDRDGAVVVEFQIKEKDMLSQEVKTGEVNIKTYYDFVMKDVRFDGLYSIFIQEAGNLKKIFL